MKKFTLPLFTSFALILSACGANEENHDAEHHEEHESGEHTSHNHLSGDLQEMTASATELPKFLDSQHEDIRLVYAAAGKATEILQWMPCYCGCGESAGHRSNLNCFIAEIREDGSVVWDDHGTRCLTYLEIAVESIQLYQDGKSLKEIRNIIDTKYQDGYATPTPTEMPA